MNFKVTGNMEHLNKVLRFDYEDIFLTNHFDSSTTSVNGAFMLFQDLLRKIEAGEIKDTDVSFRRDHTKKNLTEILNLYKKCQKKNDVNSLTASFSNRYSDDGDKTILFIEFHEVERGLMYDIAAIYYDLKTACFNSNIINTERVDNMLNFYLYNLDVKNGECNVELLESKSIRIEPHKGFVLDGTVDEYIEFFNKDDGMLARQIGLLNNAIFDIYSYEDRFCNHYGYLPRVFMDSRDAIRFSSSAIFTIYNWFSNPDYFKYIEVMIERDEVDKVRKSNPYFTGQDHIPSINDLSTISPRATALMKELNLKGRDYLDILCKLEKNPKIGKDGLIIILETLLKMDKINENKEYDDRIDFIGLYARTDDTLEDINIIMNTFDITVKNLMNRLIREMFYNNMQMFTVTRYIIDYIRMCKQQNIECGDKLPKDVLHRHDILATRIKEEKNAEVIRLFIERAKENKKLIQSIPNDDKYTIIVPEQPKDLTTEGFNLSHCVGTYSANVAMGISKIFFVRKKDTPDISLATLELNNKNELIQFKGFGNKSPEKDAWAFVEKWIKMI